LIEISRRRDGSSRLKSRLCSLLVEVVTPHARIASLFDKAFTLPWEEQTPIVAGMLKTISAI